MSRDSLEIVVFWTSPVFVLSLSWLVDCLEMASLALFVLFRGVRCLLGPLFLSVVWVCCLVICMVIFPVRFALSCDMYGHISGSVCVVL